MQTEQIDIYISKDLFKNLKAPADQVTAKKAKKQGEPSPQRAEQGKDGAAAGSAPVPGRAFDTGFLKRMTGKPRAGVQTASLNQVSIQLTDFVFKDE